MVTPLPSGALLAYPQRHQGAGIFPLRVVSAAYLPEVAFGPGSPSGLRYPEHSALALGEVPSQEDNGIYGHAPLAAYPLALPGTVRLTWHFLASYQGR